MTAGAMSYLVIVNPASGRGRAPRRGQAFAKALASTDRVELLETAHRGAATELVAERAGRVDRVIAIGGDGTLNEVLSGLFASGLEPPGMPALGFLPAGTANAATRAFGFGANPSAVARALPTAEVRPVDVGIARSSTGERPFLLWCGAGFDAVVVESMTVTRTRFMGVSGLAARVPRILGDLVRYDPPAIELEVDGTPQAVASSVIMANVGEVAFGGSVAEHADPFDGKVDVVALPTAARFALARMSVSLVTGSLTRLRDVRHLLATDVELRSEGEVPVQIDGEPAGTLPLSVRLQEGAIRLLLT